MNYYNYFTEVEDEFVRRRGSHMLISPLDWSLIETWKQRGVPLHIALRGINSSFDVREGRAPRARKVNSLFYCQQEVESLFADYCQSRVGGNGGNGNGAAKAGGEGSPFSAGALRVFLSEGRETLARLGAEAAGDAPLAETFARAAERLGLLAAEAGGAEAVNPEVLEADLTQIEGLVMAGLRASAGAEALAGWRREGDAKLRHFRTRMEPPIYEQTLENFVSQRLRERYRVPRLSLFYL